ncbi:MAG: ester cyclase [Solirubrobacterales bacterium]|nr:ester cyclase [Solirubrobacterales bacterium]
MSAVAEARHEDLDRWVHAWNTHDMNKVVALFAPAGVLHQPQNPEPLDPAAMTDFFNMNFTAIPGYKFEIELVVVEGPYAASFERATGTFTAPFVDQFSGRTIPPTGRKLDVHSVIRLTYDENHLITEGWIYWDRATFAEQLGISMS